MTILIVIVKGTTQKLLSVKNSLQASNRREFSQCVKGIYKNPVVQKRGEYVFPLHFYSTLY